MKLLKSIPVIFLFINVLTFVKMDAQPEMRPPQGFDGPRTSGVVMGTIVDENSIPLQYATINVKKVTDSLTAQYGITDADGKFMLEGIPFGKYFIEIQYIGYQKSYSSPFVISKENAVYKINKFKMTNKNRELDNVVVKAQKDMLQTNLDKTVFNVESSISSAGQTAVEVLEEIPSVDVDVEGNVSLRGSENVTILVDGRATNLTLEQIPADMIESIEVITNPSARLEPDGMAGILNVVLKKKKESGFNGLLTVGASSSFMNKKIRFSGYNGDLSFNYRYNKFNLFFSYGIRNHSHKDAGILTRDSWAFEDTSRLEQASSGTHGGLFQHANLAMDYFFNKYNSLSLTLGGHFGGMNNDRDIESMTQRVFGGDTIPQIHYMQDGTGKNKFYNYDVALNYKKTFETPGRELTADVFFSQRFGNFNNNLAQTSLLAWNPNYYQTTTTVEDNKDASAQVDFVTPVGNGGRIETGYKFSYRGVGQDYSLFDGNIQDSLTEDLSQRNDFYYSEYLNALYFIYSNTFWKKLKLQAGLRGEIANTISDLKSADTVYRFNYYNLFPTVHLKYDITPEHGLQFSYSRRVQRPRIHQLNPFINYSDKENLSQGNPYLEPEFANSFELGYVFSKNQSYLTLSGFYRQRTNMVTRYTTIHDTINDLGEPWQYTMTSYRNFNKSQNFGVEVFFSQKVKKFWKFNITGSFYRNIIDADSLIDENLSRDWAWNVGLNQTFTVGKDFDIQLNFRYRSSSLTAGSMGWGTGGVGQGRRSASYRASLGVKKGFLNNSLLLSLNIRNFLYFIPKVRQTEILSWQGIDEPIGYDSYSLRENEGFNISLNLTYKLNNYRQRQIKTSDMGTGEEGEM